MKKNLLLLVMMLLPMVASADAVEIDGIYYSLNSDAKTAVVVDNPNKYSGNVAIPENVKYEGTEYSVTSIGERAFRDCSGLTSITIGNSVTSIGNQAFYSCIGLTSITIPGSVTSIGVGAFAYCSGLLDMFCYAENVPTTGSDAFNRSNIANATLHVPAGSVGAYQAADQWKNFKEIVGLSGTETQKCATPTIKIVGGEVAFECETEDVTYKATYQLDNAVNNIDGEKVVLAGTTNCVVSVYATKEGYEDSDIATAKVEIAWGKKGDVNQDGEVNVGDIVTVTNIMAGKDN